MSRSTMAALPKTTCLICGSNSFHTYAQGQGYLVLRCSQCGLVFNHSEHVSSTKEIYAKGYYQSDQPDFGYENYVANRKDIQTSFRRRMKQIIRHKQIGKLLDVGCACGFFVEVAAEFGFEPEGIDCSDWATGYAHQNLPYKIYTGYVDQSPQLKDSDYDVITCWDVIEQLPDSRQTFEAVSKLLKPGGILALTIRDVDSFMSRMMKTKWIHFRPKEKFIYFSKKTIVPFLESLGFEMLSISPKDAGKDCTFDILLHKVSHASRPIAELLKKVAQTLGVEKKTVYLNFLDSMIVIARKK